MEQCKVFSVERDLLKEELQELRTAAQDAVDLVDPVEGGTSTSKTLVERLRGAPQRVAGYLTETSKQCVAHVMGLVKSYWPEAKVALLGDDMFIKYVEEAEPVAEQIVKMLEQ